MVNFNLFKSVLKPFFSVFGIKKGRVETIKRSISTTGTVFLVLRNVI